MRKGPVMILLPCPWCGPREATEFAHVGEVSTRPDPGSATPAQWRGYLYLRANPCGWTTESWYHWGSDPIFFFGGMDFKVYDRILAIQRIVLNQCLNGGVLARIQNQELQADSKTKPLQMAEVFSTLTDGVWSDLGSATISTVRRNLQREYVRRLATIVVGNRRNPYEDYYSFVLFLGGNNMPADAKSLARMHLGDLNDKIKRAIDSKRSDDTTRAHLIECRQRITKALDSSYTTNEL